LARFIEAMTNQDAQTTHSSHGNFAEGQAEPDVFPCDERIGSISLAAQMLAFAEGLLLAAHDGVDPELAANVMADSAIGSPMLKARVPLVLDLPDDAWFDVALMDKDIRLALAAARDLDAPLPSAAVADQLLGRAVALGYEHRDIAALFEVLERLAQRATAETV
jgi:NAD-binding of NADP-dependent 3-hydroxyisobutyrate dehydrogenase